MFSVVDQNESRDQQDTNNIDMFLAVNWISCIVVNDYVILERKLLSELFFFSFGLRAFKMSESFATVELLQTPKMVFKIVVEFVFNRIDVHVHSCAHRRRWIRRRRRKIVVDAGFNSIFLTHKLTSPWIASGNSMVISRKPLRLNGFNSTSCCNVRQD